MTTTRVDSLRLFATAIEVYDLPGMDVVNRELSERLLAEAGAAPGITRSNVGGWHSPADLAHREDLCYRALMQVIVDHVAETLERLAGEAGLAAPPRYRYGLNAWAMVMRDGDYTVLHDHGDSHFSSAYYVDAGDAAEDRHPLSGLLSFIDPRRGGPPIAGLDLYPSTFTVRPRTGMLVLFPGFLQHFVHAYRGHRPRIAISCNVHLSPAR